jgi:hypothetical protein
MTNTHTKRGLQLDRIVLFSRQRNTGGRFSSENIELNIEHRMPNEMVAVLFDSMFGVRCWGCGSAASVSDAEESGRFTEWSSGTRAT